MLLFRCDLALEIDPDSVKGHYRKGLAYQYLHEFDAAKQEYADILHLTSYILHLTSCILHLTSYILHGHERVTLTPFARLTTHHLTRPERT